MQGAPYHPALVHVPLGLALVLVVLQACLLLAIQKSWFSPASWALSVLFQALLLGSCIVALQTGDLEASRIQALLTGDFLMQHATQARFFLAAAVVAFLLSGLPLVFRSPRLAAGSRWFCWVLSLGIFFLALKTGSSGAALVYLHGGAQAAISAGQGQTQEP